VKVETESQAKLLFLASHELRTPVSVVSGYLRMLQGDTGAPLSARQRKMVEEAERSCARIAALLGEMSELARLDEATPNLQTFDLFPLLDDVAAGMEEATDRGVALELRGAASGGHVSADPAGMRRAFAALFRAVLREQGNACRVVVERRILNGAAHVAIAHEGEVEGVWTAEAAPFNEYRGGLGLELPIARRIVELAGGRIESVFLGSHAGAILVTL
jgi:signal transduction histidine kinase